ncbi:MAG: AAA family ATPase [Chloroflexi bacterium]|nr:AAA family ATPase [Chloroflexota bacterium]
MGIYFLFPSNVTRDRKRALIAQVASWKDTHLPPIETSPLAALEHGIGSGGMGYNMRRPQELAFLTRFTLRLKALPLEERRTLLADSARLTSLLNDTTVPWRGAERFQLRLMLPHLILPEHFERIASDMHKQQIIKAFAHLLPAGATGSLDERLYAIRQRLEASRPGVAIDFYQPDLEQVWRTTGDGKGDPTASSSSFWVIHAGSADEADALFREYGVIAVGWDELGDLTELEPTRDAFKEAVKATYPTYATQATRNAAGQLLRFVHAMKVGDTVFYPARATSLIHVGRVTGDYRYDPSRHEQFPHQRSVAWLRAVPRSAFSAGARNEMSGLMTLFAVDRHAAEYAAARDGAPLPIESTGSDGRAPRPPVVIGPGPELPDATLLTEMAEALERKGQLILYGPPGTGKTYSARRFAVWWLLRASPGVAVNAVLTDPAAFRTAEAALAAPAPDDGPGRLTALTFHPSYAYEDFIEGYKPASSPDGTLRLVLADGVFKRVCHQAAQNPNEHYLVLVDEINRANIARVFGELITLLERDKRGITVTLPQSKQPFTIPPNVAVVGTMNTADKSIKLLDAALRRRFAFIELLPDPTLLAGEPVRGLALDTFLAELNRRVAQREGREKQIGHAFLLDNGQPVTSPEEVARRFRQEILPLLQEYCYDDYAELAAYVGDTLVDKESQRLRDAMDDRDALLAALATEFQAPPAPADGS